MLQRKQVNLIQHKVELSISLLHLVPFQQTEVGTAKQMVLDMECTKSSLFPQ